MKMTLILALALSTSAQAGCLDVVKLVASKSLELSIIVNQKTTEMVKVIGEASGQAMTDVKKKKVSFDMPDMMADLTKENSELNHVNAVLGNEIGKLIKNNPKCFR